MTKNNSAILALVLLTVVVIVVVVALAYNPAPAAVVNKEQSAKDLLKSKCNDRSNRKTSGMSPPSRIQLSPDSVQSMSNEPWKLLDELRAKKAGEQRK